MDYAHLSVSPFSTYTVFRRFDLTPVRWFCQKVYQSVVHRIEKYKVLELIKISDQNSKRVCLPSGLRVLPLASNRSLPR